MIQAGGGGSLPGHDGDNIDVLDFVELISFDANPVNIGPFGMSVLSWEIRGPDGFELFLDYERVGKVGSRTVQPVSSRAYHLTAIAGSAAKPLGTVQVHVDLQSCIALPVYTDPAGDMSLQLTNELRDSPEYYFPVDGSSDSIGQPTFMTPQVKISQDRISFRVWLHYRLKEWYKTDPLVTINASFGLSVSNGALVSNAEDASADVSVPPWGWGLGWITSTDVQGLIDKGEERARGDALDLIKLLVWNMNTFGALPRPDGYRFHSVQISGGNGGKGSIDVVLCPDTLLTSFAGISDAKEIRKKGKSS